MNVQGVKGLSLVKYAGDYWVTLADFTQTRSAEGYSDHASVKSAIRTYVVRQDPNKYIAFRGELQIKNIIQENKDNPLFYPGEFYGHTRTALIHWDMVEKLEGRFKVSDKYSNEFPKFIKEALRFIQKDRAKAPEVVDPENDILKERSTMLRYLRGEIAKLDAEIEVRQTNREKLLQAINALETLELPEI